MWSGQGFGDANRIVYTVLMASKKIYKDMGGRLALLTSKYSLRPFKLHKHRYIFRDMVIAGLNHYSYTIWCMRNIQNAQPDQCHSVHCINEFYINALMQSIGGNLQTKTFFLTAFDPQR